MVTGSQPVSLELHMGQCKLRPDLKTTHEEADVIIVQRVIHLSNRGVDTIQVICDDTDVFVLLLHFYVKLSLTSELSMIGTTSNRSTTDIKATAAKHGGLAADLPAAHALSGRDIVSNFFGIRKVSVIKALKAGHSLSHLGDLNSNMHDIFDQATKFIAFCYGSQATGDMRAVRYDAWSSKTSKKNMASAPLLKSLPPTKEAFSELVSRAHYQTLLLKSAVQADPPDMDPELYGWSFDKSSQTFIPVTLPSGVPTVPEEILHLIKCGCSSSLPCSTMRCTCASAKLACSMFCTCKGDSDCCNECTKALQS